MEKLARIVLFCCGLFLLASCSTRFGGDDGSEKTKLKPLSCIVVLPARPVVDRQDAPSLEEGAAFITQVMARDLGGNDKVRLLTESQVASLAPEVSKGLYGMVTNIGEKVGCGAVLMTTVSRFRQREGTEYAVQEPASADFQMKLLSSPGGEVLWTADFRETQESLFDNILSYQKAQRRGFKWVTVEHLVEQGVQERLAACPYLKQSADVPQ